MAARTGLPWLLSRIVFPGRVLVACAALVFVSGLQQAPDASAQDTPAPAVQTEPKPAVINGFKTAKFGMDEGRLRVAIAKDFGIGEEGVRKFMNEAQKTTILRIVAPRLNPKVPDHPTVISYILGYGTNKLIQVNLTWGTDLTPGLSVPDLNTKAALYRQRLLTGNFVPGKTRAGIVQLEDGSRRLFTSQDKDGHSVVLRTRIVEVERRVAASQSEQQTPETKKVRAKRLLLSYIENPEDPKIFKEQ